MLPRHSLLFRSISGFIKYFFLTTVGLMASFLLASLFAQPLLALAWITVVVDWWWRLALGSFFTLGCAVIFESFQ
ncbi:MAG: hypothetical protein KGQ93_10770 [Cyanobacteria bacterium REEB459]|nr:hypothetical protein [Cyanobacteria bacterium REEB459]